MGVDLTALRGLLLAKNAGADFTRCATLGRQRLYVTKEDIARCFQLAKRPLLARELDSIFAEPFAEGLLRHLGADRIDSIDANDYERATVIHDMNTPIEASLKQRYTMIVDGGTLEHIFNFPTAATNLIDMLAPGGHVLSIVPANNFCGHGFYQFSPELFFRVFSSENGCKVLCIFLATAGRENAWHLVTDPVLLRGRVTLQNFLPTSLVMLASRTCSRRNAHFVPQQSDYELGHWVEGGDVRQWPPSLKSRVRTSLPHGFQDALLSARHLIAGPGFRRGYRSIAPEGFVDMFRSAESAPGEIRP